MQLVRAFAAVANGGWLVQPRIVWRMVRDDEVHVVAPRQERRILSLQTTKQLSSMLRAAVDYGTGQAAAVDGYTIAGKTGTAQKIDPVKGGYSQTEVLVSFVGYAPAEAPQVVVLVMIDEPQDKRWGGQAAAPVFRRVVQQTLHYLQVPPSQAPRLPLPVTNIPMVTGRQMAQRLAPPVGTGVVRLLGTH
jgi:cell division protein FtsI (penicillin-binding protein 3)